MHEKRLESIQARLRTSWVLWLQGKITKEHCMHIFETIRVELVEIAKEQEPDETDK